MTVDNPKERAFLFALYDQTQGDETAQASMYELGESMGLERAEAGSLAESLFIQGLAELKTLSGGMGITGQGLELLDISPPRKQKPKPASLGSGQTLEASGKSALEAIMQDIREAIARGLAYDALEEAVMDLKTIEVQLLSPRPKTGIIRETLTSIRNGFKAAKKDDLNDLVTRLTILIR